MVWWILFSFHSLHRQRWLTPSFGCRTPIAGYCGYGAATWSRSTTSQVKKWRRHQQWNSMNANLFFLWTRAHENPRKLTRDWRLLPHSCNQFHVSWHVFSSHWTVIVIRYSSLIDKMSFVLMSRRKCDKPLLLWNEGDPAPIYILCIAGRHVRLTGRWMPAWSVTALLRMRDMTSLKSLRGTWFVQRCASRQSHTWHCHVLNSLPVSHQRTATPTPLAHAPCDVIVLSSLLTVMT